MNNKLKLEYLDNIMSKATHALMKKEKKNNE